MYIYLRVHTSIFFVICITHSTLHTLLCMSNIPYCISVERSFWMFDIVLHICMKIQNAYFINSYKQTENSWDYICPPLTLIFPWRGLHICILYCTVYEAPLSLRSNVMTEEWRFTPINGTVAWEWWDYIHSEMFNKNLARSASVI
jgi:hypothetical protein